MPDVRFIQRPDALPDAPDEGRVALIDLAFASGADFERVTHRFLKQIGARLAIWIDHHDHPEWESRKDDPRFVLVSKLQARACPQLVDARAVKKAGEVDELWAHADFDGCVGAAKFLRDGVAPYAEADEDARFADAPGKGFTCSARGKRYIAALDELQIHASREYDGFLHELCLVLRNGGDEPPAFTQRVASLGTALEEHRRFLAPVLAKATRPRDGVMMLSVGRMSTPDKKFLLRQMEEQARVAVIHGEDWTTIATFDDEELDLSVLPGLRGQRGYAFGQVQVHTLLKKLYAML